MTSELDVDGLRRLLAANGVDVHGRLSARKLTGGRSNLTFVVSDDVSRWVVRRPPLAGLTPSAHDMAREYRVTKALQGTAVPVATAIALDPDGAYIGAPVSVVQFVDGTAFRSRDDLAALGDADLGRVCDALVDTLVALHSVDHESVGLEGFGRPDGFVTRQVKLWTRQWEHVRSREFPDLDRLSGLLFERVPIGGSAAIVHGDFRIDNTLVDVTKGRPIRAVVDWELSTVGDPLTDAALMCVYRLPAFDAILGFPAAWTSSRLPGADELAERYSTRSGRDLGDWHFYLGLACFKLAVIAEGIAHRARSAPISPGAASEAGLAVPELVAAGLRALSQPS